MTATATATLFALHPAVQHQYGCYYCIAAASVLRALDDGLDVGRDDLRYLAWATDTHVPLDRGEFFRMIQKLPPLDLLGAITA